MAKQPAKKKVVKKTAKKTTKKIVEKVVTKDDKKTKPEAKKDDKKKPVAKKRDKIFGNDFNTGNIDPTSFPDIQIEAGYAGNILGDCYDNEEYTEKKRILELTVEIFHDSQWGNLTLEKKFSKELQPFIFNDLYQGLDGHGFTTIDIFICIAEFMDVSYERIYEVAGLKMKEQLINELDAKYKMLNRKKINRLF